MTELAVWTLAFAAGLALGAAYLAFLWAAIRLFARRQGVGVFVGLAAARGGLVLAALALAVALGIGAGGILAGLLGFVAVRLAASRFAGAPGGEEGSWK